MGYQEAADGRGELCSVARRMLELDDDDRQALDSDLANHLVSSRQIYVHLRNGRTEAETRVGERSIGDHRKGICPCGTT